jgi:hypothetical protein
MNKTVTILKAGQYHFFEFNNLIPAQVYVVYFTSDRPTFLPLFIQKQAYPTQNNCPDTITQKTPNTYMSVITAQSQFLSLGLTAPNDVNYAMDAYMSRSETLNIGVASQPVTLKASEFTFYTYQLVNGQVPTGSFFRITSMTGVAVPLMFISSTAQFPTQWDNNPAPTQFTQLIPGGMDLPISQTDRFAAIYNPFTNQNDAQFTVMMVNAATTTGVPNTNGPTVLPNQNVILGLSLPAIIGIAVGGAVLIAVVLVGVWIYSKRKSKRRAEKEYKPVPNPTKENENPNEKGKEKGKAEKPKREEESTTPSDSEEDEDTDSEDNEYGDQYEDSYPPRRSSRISGRRPSRYAGPPKRGPNRPSDSRRNRERSYSDDDDEDDYSSDDYS